MTRRLELDLSANHAQDPDLQPFLQVDFDPATYLNNTLPSLSNTSNATRTISNTSSSLTEVSLAAQTLLSRLSSQTTRLSNALTQATDEIVRSGGRLTYEVELLRGEAIGLVETLHDSLRKEYDIFVIRNEDNLAKDSSDVMDPSTSQAGQPEYLSTLHTLTLIRERLDSVMRTFDEAMRWPAVPVDNPSNALISVSAPSNSSGVRDLQMKAKDYLDSLKQEISSLLSQGDDGHAAAVEKLEHMKLLTEVWKSTAEESTRQKVIDELQKLVDDQHKTTAKGKDAGAGMAYRALSNKVTTESSYGFLNNLRNLKNEVYLD